MKGLKQLKQDKERAKQEIDRLSGLTNEQKQHFYKLIDKQTDYAGIRNVQNQALAAHREGEWAKELKQYKEQIKQNIDRLSELSNEQKQHFHKLIDKQTHRQEILNVWYQAFETHRQQLYPEQLEQPKERMKQNINALDELTEEQKQSFYKQIDEQTTLQEVHNVWYQAYETHKQGLYPEQFKRNKEQIKRDIHALGDGLTEEQRQAFIEQVDAQTTQQGLQKVWNEAFSTYRENVIMTR